MGTSVISKPGTPTSWNFDAKESNPLLYETVLLVRVLFLMIKILFKFLTYVVFDMLTITREEYKRMSFC